MGLSHPNIDEISHENTLSDVAILHGIIGIGLYIIKYIYILILMEKCSQKWDAIDIIGMACILHGIFPNILYQPWLRLGC